MKSSGFKIKPRKPLKQAKLAYRGTSEVSVLKDRIQLLLREIVILRDKKCILYGLRCYHEYGKDDVVWQAEHLIERSNSETFADSRLVVLVCKNCHGWKHFKKSNHDQYGEWVKTKLSQERVTLWEECNKRRFNSFKMGAYDWKLEVVNLESELKELKK